MNKSEDQLKKNIQEQQERLLQQLKDLEEVKDEVSKQEYEYLYFLINSINYKYTNIER